MIQPNPSITVKVEDLEIPRPFSAFYASALGRVTSIPEGFVLCVNNCPRELPATINKGDLISCKAVAEEPRGVEIKTIEVKATDGANAKEIKRRLGDILADVRATLPDDSATRKGMPMCSGCLDYFPAALAMVAKLSKFGNDKHNPGEPLHHARGKSTDHADCIIRHMVDRDQIDPETKMLHMVEVAWRALALLQEMLEARGAPLARGARLPESTK